MVRRAADHCASRLFRGSLGLLEQEKDATDADTRGERYQAQLRPRVESDFVQARHAHEDAPHHDVCLIDGHDLQLVIRLYRVVHVLDGELRCRHDAEDETDEEQPVCGSVRLVVDHADHFELQVRQTR